MNLRDIWGESIISSSDKRKRLQRKITQSQPFSWLEGMKPEPEKLDSFSNLWTTFTYPSVRSVVLFLIVLLSFLVLSGRLFYLQVVSGARYRSLSDSNHYRRQVIRAPRGVIYDRYDQPLVENKPGFSLVWDSSAQVRGSDLETVIDDSYFVETLAPMIGLSPQELRSKLEQGRERSSVVLAAGLTREQVTAVEMSFSLPPLHTEVVPLRNYLFGEEFAHVLGFTGEASVEDLQSSRGLGMGARLGKTGLEKEFDLLLRGHPGRRVLEVNVLGETVTEKAREEAVSGQVLRTSLDKDLQLKSFEELRKGVQSSNATGGSVVALDPRNGEILSLVSYPSYDSNRFVSGIDSDLYREWETDPQKPLFNRAISGTYAPGSTFKPLVATAALEEGIVNASSTVNCTGAISVGSVLFRDWTSAGHGVVDIVDAIAKSCNIYFYTIGGGYDSYQGLGPDAIADWAQKFGLGEPLEIGYPWEARGLVPSPEWKERIRGERWYLGNTYHYAIGQGDLLVTPLQITNALSAVVNGGTLYRPTFLRNGNDNILRGSLAFPETLEKVREGMRAVCEPGGTAYPFFDFPFEVGGKTGTGETGKSDSTHAWFFVYGPGEEPEIALTVFLENGGSGAQDAAPVAREIMDWYAEERITGVEKDN